VERRLTRRELAVKRALDSVRTGCDVVARRNADPVAFAHRYEGLDDRELVALVAASVAFGNVAAIRSKLDDLLRRLGSHPARVADDPAEARRRLRGWKHRVFRGVDVARLLCGARTVQRMHGSLGRFFEAELRRTGQLREALACWCDAIRGAGGLRRDGPRRGPAHLLSDPRGPSGSKRLLLFLRWMVRPADGIDLGLWEVDPAVLLVPVDVHIHKLSRNLGLTRAPTPSWSAAEEISGALARFDRADPTKYDFSLCHMGMVQRCRSRRDPSSCQGCGVKPVCIHWADEAPLSVRSIVAGSDNLDRERRHPTDRRR
jgi:uncharacterized protein (TIGR02757 family)